jgi:CDP-glucose 4,6-dehydratase
MEPSRLVPDAARALVQGERPVIRSDGTPERDFLYVEDAVDAYLTVAEAVGDPRHPEPAWNAGSGRAVAIRELIERLIAVSGRDVTPDVQGKPQPRDDVDRQVLDSGKIADELGWRPAHDLDAGLDKTWRWYAEALS